MGNVTYDIYFDEQWGVMHALPHQKGNPTKYKGCKKTYIDVPREDLSQLGNQPGRKMTIADKLDR